MSASLSESAGEVSPSHTAGDAGAPAPAPPLSESCLQTLRASEEFFAVLAAQLETVATVISTSQHAKKFAPSLKEQCDQHLQSIAAEVLRLRGATGSSIGAGSPASGGDGGGDALASVVNSNGSSNTSVNFADEAGIAELTRLTAPLKSLSLFIAGSLLTSTVETQRLRAAGRDLLGTILSRAQHLLGALLPSMLLFGEEEEAFVESGEGNDAPKVVGADATEGSGDTAGDTAGNSEAHNDAPSSPTTRKTTLPTLLARLSKLEDTVADSIAATEACLQGVASLLGFGYGAPLDDSMLRHVLRIGTNAIRSLARQSLTLQVTARQLLADSTRVRGMRRAQIVAEGTAVSQAQVAIPLKMMLSLINLPATVVSERTKADVKTVLFHLFDALEKHAAAPSAPATQTNAAEPQGSSGGSTEDIAALFPPLVFECLLVVARGCGDSDDAALLCVRLLSDSLRSLASDDPATLKALLTSQRFKKAVFGGCLSCVVSVHPAVLGAGLSCIDAVVQHATAEAAQELGFLYCNCLLRLLDSELTPVENKAAIVNHLVRTTISPEAPGGRTMPLAPAERLGVRSREVDASPVAVNGFASDVATPLLLELFFRFDLSPRLHHSNFVQHVVASLSRIVRTGVSSLGDGSGGGGMTAAPASGSAVVATLGGGGGGGNGNSNNGAFGGVANGGASTTGTGGGGVGATLAFTALSALVDIADVAATTALDAASALRNRQNRGAGSALATDGSGPRFGAAFAAAAAAAYHSGAASRLGVPPLSTPPLLRRPVASALPDLAALRTRKMELQRAVDVVNLNPMKGIGKLFNLPHSLLKGAPSSSATSPVAAGPRASDAVASPLSPIPTPHAAASPHGIPLTPEEETAAAEKVATLLLYTPSINAASVGEFVSDGSAFAIRVCRTLLGRLSLRGKSLTGALAEVLSVLQLPKEGQRIERLLEHAAAEFFAANSDLAGTTLFPFKSEDACFLVIVATVMLNTDLHNPRVATRMDKKSFCAQLRGCNAGGSFPEGYVEDIFDTIQQRPLSNLKGLGAATLEGSAHISTAAAAPQGKMDMLFFSRDERKSLMLGLERQRIVTETREAIGRRAPPLSEDAPVPPAEALAKDMFACIWPSLLAVFSVALQGPNLTENAQERCIRGLLCCLLTAATLGLAMETEATLMSLVRLGAMKALAIPCGRAVLQAAAAPSSLFFNASCWKCVLALLSDVKRGGFAELAPEAEAVYDLIPLIAACLIVDKETSDDDASRSTVATVAGSGLASPAANAVAPKHGGVSEGAAFSSASTAVPADARPIVARALERYGALLAAATSSALAVGRCDAVGVSAMLYVMRRVATAFLGCAPTIQRTVDLWSEVVAPFLLFMSQNHGPSEECLQLIFDSVFALLQSTFSHIGQLRECAAVATARVSRAELRDGASPNCTDQRDAAGGGSGLLSSLKASVAAATPFDVLLKLYHGPDPAADGGAALASGAPRTVAAAPAAATSAASAVGGSAGAVDAIGSTAVAAASEKRKVHLLNALRAFLRTPVGMASMQDVQVARALCRVTAAALLDASGSTEVHSLSTTVTRGVVASLSSAVLPGGGSAAPPSFGLAEGGQGCDSPIPAALALHTAFLGCLSRESPVAQTCVGLLSLVVASNIQPDSPARSTAVAASSSGTTTTVEGGLSPTWIAVIRPAAVRLAWLVRSESSAVRGKAIEALRALLGSLAERPPEEAADFVQVLADTIVRASFKRVGASPAMAPLASSGAVAAAAAVDTPLPLPVVANASGSTGNEGTAGVFSLAAVGPFGGDPVAESSSNLGFRSVPARAAAHRVASASAFLPSSAIPSCFALLASAFDLPSLNSDGAVFQRVLVRLAEKCLLVFACSPFAPTSLRVAAVRTLVSVANRFDVVFGKSVADSSCSRSAAADPALSTSCSVVHTAQVLVHAFALTLSSCLIPDEAITRHRLAGSDVHVASSGVRAGGSTASTRGSSHAGGVSPTQPMDTAASSFATAPLSSRVLDAPFAMLQRCANGWEDGFSLTTLSAPPTPTGSGHATPMRGVASSASFTIDASGLTRNGSFGQAGMMANNNNSSGRSNPDAGGRVLQQFGNAPTRSYFVDEATLADRFSLLGSVLLAIVQYRGIGSTFAPLLARECAEQGAGDVAAPDAETPFGASDGDGGGDTSFALGASTHSTEGDQDRTAASRSCVLAASAARLLSAWDLARLFLAVAQASVQLERTPALLDGAVFASAKARPLFVPPAKLLHATLSSGFFALTLAALRHLPQLSASVLSVEAGTTHGHPSGLGTPSRDAAVGNVRCNELVTLARQQSVALFGALVHETVNRRSAVAAELADVTEQWLGLMLASRRNRNAVVPVVDGGRIEPNEEVADEAVNSCDLWTVVASHSAVFRAVVDSLVTDAPPQAIATARHYLIAFHQRELVAPHGRGTNVLALDGAVATPVPRQ